MMTYQSSHQKTRPQKLVKDVLVTTKVAALLVCFYSLLLLQTPSVEAVDIIGYTSTNGCDGDAIGCYNAGSNLCCVLNRASARIILGNCQTGVVYTGNGCQNTRDSRSGPLNICFQNYGVSAGRWFSTCLADSSSQESSATCGLSRRSDAGACTSTALPNAVMYSPPGSSNGTWVLETGSDKVYDMLAQLQTVPLGQKESWLEGMGAHFKEHQLKTVDVRSCDMHLDQTI